MDPNEVGRREKLRARIEGEVQETIETMDREYTTITVAHRLSTLGIPTESAP